MTFLVILFCCGAAGCSSGHSAPPRGTVQGSVTLDEIPIAAGEIVFYPTGETKGPATFGRIKDGKYEFAMADAGPIVGTNRVEIRWRRPTGKKDSQGFDVVEETVPAKFNSATTLISQVQPGIQVIDYSLKSK